LRWSRSIRYTIDPNKLNDFRTYVEAEQEPIRRSGGKVAGYSFPTDFAGPTNEALGLIDLPNVPAYEQHRNALANDPDHKKNAARLEQSGAVMAMNRSIIQRLDGNA
jgi:NIPSNAP